MTSAVDKSVESVEKSLLQRHIHRCDNTSQVLGVFAKQPLAGQVKTRLCPPCSAAQAAALYQVCLAETVARFCASARSLVLFYSGDAGWFAEHFPGVDLHPQGDGDLGRRMQRALDGLLADGCSAAGLIGTDSPDLPQVLVDEAFSALAETDAVLAPADDGGYVLIGCRRPCPQLFQNIAWSTGGVLEQTRAAARLAGISLQEVTSWEDLDDVNALRRLVLRSPESETARFIRSQLPNLLV